MNAAVAPALGAVVLGGELGVEAVGEGDEAVRVGPEGEEAAGFPGGAGGDGGGFEEGDCVEGRVVGLVAREEVGGCAADDAAAWGVGLGGLARWVGTGLRTDDHDVPLLFGVHGGMVHGRVGYGMRRARVVGRDPASDCYP